MSAFQTAPTSAPNGGAEPPEFPGALRGYDRQRVDVFIKELKGRLEAERRRVELTERTVAQLRHELNAARNQPAPSFEHLGLEAAKVLEQAGGSAKLLVEEARSRGEAIVQAAEGQAAELILRAEERAGELEAEARRTLAGASDERDRIVAEASTEAEELRRGAEEDARASLDETREVAERIREKARHEQMAMQADTERLRESRDRMIEYLSRIHADLVTLLSEASSGPIPETAPQEEEREVVDEELEPGQETPERAEVPATPLIP
jgi:cell division septum initiation protein DivIVA